MRSVADSLRGSTRATTKRRDPGERIAEALALGDADARLFASARRISVDEARRQLARHRQHGRGRSACHDQLLA